MSLEQISLQYSTLQNEIQELYGSRQKLETQFQENKIVNDEFGTLNDEKVYKLTGGVLLPVDLDEAKQNVEKRLEFIANEIVKCEGQIKEKNDQLEKAQQELVRLRSQA